MNLPYKLLKQGALGALISVIPTLVVLQYLLSLGTFNRLSVDYAYFIVIGPMCMVAGFIYLTIYVFIWSTPQEIKPTQLRIMRGILIAWVPFSLSLTVHFLGFAEFPAFLRIPMCNINILLLVGWLIWGYYNIRGSAHVSLDSGAYLFAFIWSWIAYAILMFGIFVVWIIPFLEFIQYRFGGGSN